MENNNTPPDESPQAHSTREEDDVVTDLLPGAAAMKQRLPSRRAKRQEPNPPPEPPKPKRQKLNVLEAARQRREAQEEAAQERIKEEEDTIQTTLSSMDVERMKSLAVVEEIEIPARRRPTPAADDEGHNNRWDDRWNGRKNFKNFRRAGDSGGPRRRVQTLIVPLEEAGRKGFGIGEEYWAGGSHNNSGTGNGRGTSAISNSRDAISQEDQSMDTSQPVARDPGTASAASTSRTRKRPRQAEENEDSEDELRFQFRRRKRA